MTTMLSPSRRVGQERLANAATSSISRVPSWHALQVVTSPPFGRHLPSNRPLAARGRCRRREPIRHNRCRTAAGCVTSGSGSRCWVPTSLTGIVRASPVGNEGRAGGLARASYPITRPDFCIKHSGPLKEQIRSRCSSVLLRCRPECG